MVEHTGSTPYVSVMDQYGYQIGKVIGHGSYGTVYEAYFSKQKTMVAIKIISKKKASEDYLTKFLPREIQVVTQCDGGWGNDGWLPLPFARKCANCLVPESHITAALKGLEG